MESKDIFHALQTGRISLEDAESELKKVKAAALERTEGYLPSQKPMKTTEIEMREGEGCDCEPESIPSVVKLYEVGEGIALIEMQDREHKNSFSKGLAEGLNQCFDMIDNSPDYKVVILTGYDNYFASGGTKEALLDIYDGKMKYTDTNVYRLALDCKLPVIAAMQGHAFGAGWCMGMFCDFVVMAKESVYSANFMKFGFTPGAGATLVFPKKLGMDIAHEILFSGKKYYGSELEDRRAPVPIMPRKEVLSYSVKLAQTLAEASRESLIVLKEHLATSIKQCLPGTVERELKMHEKTFVHLSEVKDRIEASYGKVQNRAVQEGMENVLYKKIEIPIPKTSSLPVKIKTMGQKDTASSKVLPESSSSNHTIASEQQERDAIAVIGISGQFPKSPDINAYWDNLVNGRDCVEEIPKDRWSLEEFFDENPGTPGKTYCKWMGALEDIDKFDAMFFNILPAEAELMDPQQRLFLQNCWHCIEDAGISPSSLSGSRCSVFVGCAPSHYGDNIRTEEMNSQILLGEASSVLAARISYMLNLKGASIAVETACSSSLVAIAQACDNLVLRNSDMALAGGSCIILGPSMHVMTSRGVMLSKDGRCFAFDAHANGFVPSEGVGVVLLKRLSDAVRDKDAIYGVIRGWGTNQDGKTNGLTAPSVNSQIELEQEVYHRFGINPENISFVEAHGTGTKLGDPIEVEALTKSFQSFTDKKNYCALGSSKSNIGHCLMAAGVAGVIKVLLSLKNGMLPPTVHYRNLNEHIQLNDSPFYVNTELQPWETEDGNPKCACVSSFGLSGTNAHMVIEEYICEEQEPFNIEETRPSLFVLSAKTEEQLAEVAERIKAYILAYGNVKLEDMAYTLQVGRDAMEYRAAFEADSRNTLLEALGKIAKKQPSPQIMMGKVKKKKKLTEFFESDEEFKAFLKQMIIGGSLGKIGELWTKGLNFDWKELYGENQPGKVHMPGYPFTKERYWIPESYIAMQCKEAGKTPDITKGVGDGDKEDLKEIGTLILRPSWHNEEASGGDGQVYEQQIVILCEPDAGVYEQVRELLPGAECFVLRSDKLSIDERFQNYAAYIIDRIRHILLAKPHGRVLFQLVVNGEEEKQPFAGLSGILKSARLENPKMVAQLIETDKSKEDKDILNILKENTECPDDCHIRYQNGKRFLPRWEEVNDLQEKTEIPWKEGGVYLITGGAGGLGLIFAREATKCIQHGTILLVGRSVLDAQKKSALEEISSSGVHIEYVRADVGKSEDVEKLVEDIRKRFGQLDGILHSAGIIRDNFIIKKTTQEFLEVLSPKVSGVVHLDKYTRDMPLGFFVLFSSIAGAFGNQGQADYSTGNAFMDRYAFYRNQQVALNKCSGKTLSVNWPLWKEGWMYVDEETEKVMKENLGMIAMKTASGIHALYKGLASGFSQVLVMEGLLKRMWERIVLASGHKEAAQNAGEAVQLDSGEIKEGIANKLKELISEITKLDIGRMDVDKLLETYGIDSIVITQLNQKLSLHFASLSKTLFFEYQTIGEISEYLAEEYPKECMAWIGVAKRSQTAPNPSPSWQPISTYMTKQASVQAKQTDIVSSIDEQDGKEPIAIIGISGRYPKSATLEEYWENLKTGRECITEIPEERWPLEGFYHPDVQEAMEKRKSYSKWGGFLEGFADFDPLFFNLSPQQAMNMDPQERLFLQSCWEVLEDAGYSSEQLTQKYNRQVGVFAGITKTGFDLCGNYLSEQEGSFYPYTSFSSVANSVSYALNLNGPSMPIDTMCSSSLTAIHEACQHIHRGECCMAIAGGINLYLHPSSYIRLCAQKMLSDSDKCAAFGEAGNGFVPGEGVGCILLKPLSQAERDGDHIYAVIRGSNTNHNGKSNGYMVPNQNAQKELILKNFKKSGIDPATISYVESAAVGSKLGDAIEFNALVKAFSSYTKRVGCCAVGSVKPNIGHLEAASGISQLTKVILQMQHKQLVPSINAEPLNSNLSFDNTPFYLQRELEEWKRPKAKVGNEEVEIPRRATISSFGAGGSNAHLIVEEYIGGSDESDDLLKPQVVVLSAKNQERLLALAGRMAGFLESIQGVSLKDVAYTLQTGREEMALRLAWVAGTLQQLVDGLKSYIQRGALENPIPVFLGNLEEDGSGNKSMSEAKMDQDAVELMMQEKNLEKIAAAWVQGNTIPWDRLHEGEKVRRVSLPTYPFEKRRCWMGIQLQKPVLLVGDADRSANKEIVGSICRLLGMNLDEIKMNKPLAEYGFDSIQLMQLLRQLQIKISPTIDLCHIQGCSTIQEVVDAVEAQKSKQGADTESSIANPIALGQFPEVIRMSNHSQGRPVFWIHGAVGGVESYQSIAKSSERPFYGIQARGFMTERNPLVGVQAMAAYYVQIIQSVQPNGPYDVGGYSLGGIIAYEVVRQLQELGQTVDSLVMLDSPDGSGIEKIKLSDKSKILQAVNIAMMSMIQQASGEITDVLIHHDEVNINAEEDMLLKELISIANTRGLAKREEQIQTLIHHSAKVQQAYELDKYKRLPLGDPNSIKCYYFRNKSGLFYGKLAPYFTTFYDDISIDNTNYWEEWERLMPEMCMVDVDSSNHMLLLSEQQSCESVVGICEKLYALK